MKIKAILVTSAFVAAGFTTAGDAFARDRIQIVGSSTVFPYTQAVAEEFANVSGKAAPVVESTGTGGGMKIFCQGVGEGTADITGASRAMKKSEWEDCTKNGVTDITEVNIGFDGLSVAVSRKGEQLDVSKEDLFKALAAQVPVDGKMMDNPFKSWKEVNDKLPDVKIQVFGPPPTSGTRDAFVELAMHKGCSSLDHFKKQKEALDKKAYKKYVKENCSRMRQDGAFIEAGENDNLIVQRLDADPTAYGIFGYSFLYENQDKLQPVKIKGVEPSLDTIADGTYGISRPLFFYIKNAHRGVIPGLNEFIAEYVSDSAMGSDGYLIERGLVNLSDEDRMKLKESATGAMGMTRYTN
ncbi:MAG: substrate-binding domain-containing protein [Hyphomicrobiales bacterium]